MLSRIYLGVGYELTISQRRRSPTTTWVSGFSTKRLPFPFPSPFAFVGVFKTDQRTDSCIFPVLGQTGLDRLCTGISPERIYDGVMRYVKVAGFQ